MREIIRKTYSIRSTRHMEQLRLSVKSGLETGYNILELVCESPRSPVDISLQVDESSTSFSELMRASIGLTDNQGARMLRAAREEQRYGGENIDSPVYENTEFAIGALVLAHVSPRIDFSFTRLAPNSIDTLKILALEHHSQQMLQSA